MTAIPLLITTLHVAVPDNDSDTTSHLVTTLHVAVTALVSDTTSHLDGSARQ